MGTSGLTSLTEYNVESCNSDKFMLLFFDEANSGFKLSHATEPHLQF